MITSIVGRLIKKPEINDRVNIPGKSVVNFTVVQNVKRGQKKTGVFFNLSMVANSEPQLTLMLSFEKGTILNFSSPKINYAKMKEGERDDEETTINLYADVQNFEIVSSDRSEGGGGYGGGGYDQSAGGNYNSRPASGSNYGNGGGGSNAPAPARRPAARPEPSYADDPGPSDFDDPFAE